MTSRELKARRRLLGVTQEALAKALGVSKNTVARWERGDMPIGHKKMLDLALDYIGKAHKVFSGK